jgi:hypothetical protein
VRSLRISATSAFEEPFYRRASLLVFDKQIT